MVALNTAVDLKNQFRRASVRHAKSATITSQRKMITSQVQFQIAKFKFRQYQKTILFFRHFGKVNAAKFSRYMVNATFLSPCQGHVDKSGQ